VRIVGQRSSTSVQKASRHSEVNQKRASRFESNNQILSAPFDGGDGLPLELRCHGTRLEGSREAGVVDVDSDESPAR
jgi:hypothetical protein